MRAFSFVPLLLLTDPSFAQAPAVGQPDNAALLRAIEGLSGQMKALNSRNDRIEQRLDRLEKERQRSPAAPAGTGANAPPAAKQQAAKPSGQAVPGWFVRLIPWTPDGGNEPVAGFPGPMFEFNFDMHSRYVPDNNRYIYNGISYFNVKEDGAYVFSLVLEPVLTGDPQNMWNPLWFNCTSELFIAGNRLISGTTNFGASPRPERDVFRSQSYYGQIRLTPGPYKVEFKTDCGISPERNLTVFDKWLPVWKKNRFKVMVKTPAEPSARPFKPEELYYVGQPS